MIYLVILVGLESFQYGTNPTALGFVLIMSVLILDTSLCSWTTKYIITENVEAGALRKTAIHSCQEKSVEFFHYF